MQKVRAVGGALTLGSALTVLYLGVRDVGVHDYVGGAILVVASLALFGAAGELLRPVVGE